MASTNVPFYVMISMSSSPSIERMALGGSAAKLSSSLLLNLFYQLNRQPLGGEGQLDTLLGRLELYDDAIAVFHGGSGTAWTQRNACLASQKSAVQVRQLDEIEHLAAGLDLGDSDVDYRQAIDFDLVGGAIVQGQRAMAPLDADPDGYRGALQFDGPGHLGRRHHLDGVGLDIHRLVRVTCLDL